MEIITTNSKSNLAGCIKSFKKLRKIIYLVILRMYPHKLRVYMKVYLLEWTFSVVQNAGLRVPSMDPQGGHEVSIIFILVLIILI